MVEIKFHSIYNDLLKSVVLVAGQMPLVEIFGSQHWIGWCASEETSQLFWSWLPDLKTNIASEKTANEMSLWSEDQIWGMEKSTQIRENQDQFEVSPKIMKTTVSGIMDHPSRYPDVEVFDSSLSR